MTSRSERSQHSIADDIAIVRRGPDPAHPTPFQEAVDRLVEALELAGERGSAYYREIEELKEQLESLQAKYDYIAGAHDAWRDLALAGDEHPAAQEGMASQVPYPASRAIEVAKAAAAIQPPFPPVHNQESKP